MGFWDSTLRSIGKVTGLGDNGMADALKKQQKASEKQAALADAERKKIKDQEAAEKARLNEKKMRGLKRKFGGSGLMSSSEDTKTQLGE